MRLKIDEIVYHLPRQVVTNAELARENPHWNMGSVEERSGVVNRHVAPPEETALDLGYEACQKLFLGDGGLKKKIDGIIFCTQSGDHVMPPNACILHQKLGLGKDVFAFDFNLGCSGYIYGLALAQGLLLSKIATNILLVNADTYSKFIHRQDRSARVLFGDGAAVTHVSVSDSQQGLMDIQCSTDGRGYENFIIPAGGCRLPKSPETALLRKDTSGNIRTLENIHMDGAAILAFINTKIPIQVQEILSRNRLTLDDIDLFIFHQASQLTLDYLTRLLGLKTEKVFCNLREVGNTVSASIPIALKDALTQGRVRRGDKILLCGFGVGLSWGTAIMEL